MQCCYVRDRKTSPRLYVRHDRHYPPFFHLVRRWTGALFLSPQILLSDRFPSIISSSAYTVRILALDFLKIRYLRWIPRCPLTLSRFWMYHVALFWRFLSAFGALILLVICCVKVGILVGSLMFSIGPGE